MLNNTIVSLKDNLYEKTKNPFLGTYILVWLVRNWELVFTILNFDDDYKLSDKVEFVKLYYFDHGFLLGLLINIGWTFLVLIITYLLLASSKLISNAYENIISPWLSKKIDSKLVVPKEKFENLREERNDLLSYLRRERDTRKVLEDQITLLEIKIKDDKILKEERVFKTFHRLEIMERFNHFLSIAAKIHNQQYLDDESDLSVYLAFDLLQHVKSDNINKKYSYSLTELGKRVWNEIMFKETNYYEEKL
ncbi:hypothetical protein [Zunongwangia endophytica]|uniref:Uncharacterized protein n=1 Tax=Zunongwangia endophytica TaxID=1808945 RepID=A0ABV8H7P1_9FLAO|nr:hypothetical protein [Zunongwangia endophytica]MDN3595285.1 hypothetical protein [Zunongwangia endophytica]